MIFLRKIPSFILLAIALFANLSAETCSQGVCQVPPPCGQGHSCSCVVAPCCQHRHCNYSSDYYHASGYCGYNCCNDCCRAAEYGRCGVWMPECPPLFRPFIADPRQLTYSAGWRWNDSALEKDVIPVSFYDTFPVYRWCRVGPWGGQLQIDIEGALWATFAPLQESAPLLNADYYMGVPITYAFNRWAFRLRGYHISCHLGDEFLINNPGFDRRNPSIECIDFFASWMFTRQLRLYLGVGYIVHQDNSFWVNPFYMEGGFELRTLNMGGFYSAANLIYGTPFFAIHWRYNPDFTQHVDLTYALGYEFGKLCGLGHKVRFWLEYHDGYSVEGQFSRIPTNYISINGCYGY